MDNERIFYPNFEYPVSQLSAFSLCMDTFYISLKNGEIVHFKPDEIVDFKEWLDHFKIRNIADNDGVSLADRTANLTKPSRGFFNLFKRKKRK